MKILKNNWRLKLLSLIVAIFLWSFVISEENPYIESTLSNIPIIYENENTISERGLVILEDSRPKISVAVRGTRNQIINLTNQHIRVTTDLSSYDEGVHPLELNFDLPDGIELVSESPALNISIDAIITKDFQVDVDLQGALPEGYILESATTTPQVITVKGARSLVDSIASLKADIDATALDKDIVTNVSIQAVTEDGRNVDNVTLGQNFINVNAVVNKSKEVSLVAETEGKLPDNKRLIGITTQPQTFFIKGKAEAIDSIEEIKTSRIDLTKYRETSNIDIIPNLPTGVSLVNPDTKFTARIDIEDTIDGIISIPVEQIEIIGNPSNHKVVFSQETFNIRVEGFSDIVDELTVADFKASYSIGPDHLLDSSIQPLVNTDKDVKILKVDSIRLELIEE